MPASPQFHAGRWRAIYRLAAMVRRSTGLPIERIVAPASGCSPTLAVSPYDHPAQKRGGASD